MNSVVREVTSVRDRQANNSLLLAYRACWFWGHFAPQQGGSTLVNSLATGVVIGSNQHTDSNGDLHALCAG